LFACLLVGWLVSLFACCCFSVCLFVCLFAYLFANLLFSFQISQSDAFIEVNAMVVRLIPLEYDVFPCMRVAIYGCEGKLTDIL